MPNLSVLIVNQQIEEKGILANLGIVIGLTAGRLLPDDTFGPDVVDGDGERHLYLTRIGHYVRKAGASKLASLRKAFVDSGACTVVDYTEDAAPADYGTYSSTLGQHKGDQIVYRAVHVFGPEEVVAPLTKNLSRL